MSFEITDLFADGISTCCSASVIDPSGEGVDGICTDCKEHCGIEAPTDYSEVFNDFLGMDVEASLAKLTIRKETE